MCLSTLNPEILIAQEDITVYKSLETWTRAVRQKGIMRLFRKYKKVKEMRSSSTGHVYKVGEIQPLVGLIPVEYGKTWEVEEGYHSDVTYSPMFSNTEFKIPKGTKYIRGWFNDDEDRMNYVSETIVFVKML